MDSIAAKLNLMSDYSLAGVAAWKLGLEKAEVWDTIVAYLSTVSVGAQESLPEQSVEMQEIETDE